MYLANNTRLSYIPSECSGTTTRTSTLKRTTVGRYFQEYRSRVFVLPVSSGWRN